MEKRVRGEEKRKMEPKCKALWVSAGGSAQVEDGKRWDPLLALVLLGVDLFLLTALAHCACLSWLLGGCEY